jgi:hypothetical protein
MEYLLEKKVIINRNTKHKSLYSWCLNEQEENSSKAKIDLIPFEWRFWFTGTKLKLSNNLRIKLNNETEHHETEKKKTIYGVFKSGAIRENGNFTDIVEFSILGTSRTISEFSLTINEATDSSGETCWLNAFPSYVSEDAEFRELIEPDYAGFDISISTEKFNELVNLIEHRSIDSIRFSAKDISGIYAEWTPTIKTRTAKILTSNNTIEGVDLNDFEGTHVGKVGEFDITFFTKASLNIKEFSTPFEFENEFGMEELDYDTSENFQKNINSKEATQKIIQAIKSLKTVLWLIFFTLLLIFLK